MPTQAAFKQDEWVPCIKQSTKYNSARRTIHCAQNGCNQQDIQQVGCECKHAKGDEIAKAVNACKPSQESADNGPDGPVYGDNVSPVDKVISRVLGKCRWRDKIGIGMVNNK